MQLQHSVKRSMSESTEILYSAEKSMNESAAVLVQVWKIHC